VTAPTEGAGIVSSWVDLVAALDAEQVDPAQVGYAAAAAGLDTLGTALAPFDELAQAGFGWLIEHVTFLREPLDALAGDPAAVLVQAQDWSRVGVELRAAASDHRAGTVAGWEGVAADGYRHSAAQLASAMEEAADRAAALSQLILVTGAGVGTVRALIRDAVAEFLSLVLQYLLAAGTLAFLTAGGSLATVVLTVVTRAAELATDICRRIRQLLDTLVAAGGTAGRLAEAMQRAAAGFQAAAPGLRVGGTALQRGAEEAGVPVAIEAGKQLTAAAQELRESPRHADSAATSIPN